MYRLRQEWTWQGITHYDLKFIVERVDPAEPTTLLQTLTRYYAVSIARLLEIMQEAEFTDCRRLDTIIYQPVLVGRAA